jgi:hypothetical protein
VLTCLDEILNRGDRLELVGFCAALTHGLAYCNANDLEYYELAEYVAEQETLMRRRTIRLAPASLPPRSLARRHSMRAGNLTFEASFNRGIRACVAMLEDMDPDKCALVLSECRHGRPLVNSVLTALDEVVGRGDRIELAGFCAGLTEVIAIADENGDHCRSLESYVGRREKVMRRKHIRAVRPASRSGASPL